MTSSVVTVFGVSDGIGAAVACDLAKTYQVKGVSYDVNEDTQQELTSKEVSVTQFDRSSLDSVLKGSFGCFVVTTSDFTDRNSHEKEMRQGMAIADACKRCDVKHVIYSTQLHVAGAIGLTARHMDAKAELYDYMHQLGLPVTGVIISCLYEDMFKLSIKPKLCSPGIYAIGIPIGHASFEMIGRRDVGPIIRSVMSNRKEWLGKTLGIVGDKRTVPEICAILSCHLKPIQFFDQQVTSQEFRDLHHHDAGVNDYANQFDFYARVNQRTSLDASKRIHPQCQTFEQWVHENRDVITNWLDKSSKAANQIMLA